LKIARLFLLMLAVVASAAEPVIVDTDAGSDDLMALSFLLSRPDVRLEAVCIANGLAHVEPGGRNVLRLLALAGRGDVPVYLGRPAPLAGDNEFPAEWRRDADEMRTVSLPDAARSPQRQPAAAFLARRLSAAAPVRILALGPLTNLAEAFQRNPAAPRGISDLVIMGGALRVPGNLGDGGEFQTGNTAAEWNIFVDPQAAAQVFASGAPIRVVPLDATNRVPIDTAFLNSVERAARTPLARVVAEVLAGEKEHIERHMFYAWDPLAAVALVDPRMAKFLPVHITVRTRGREEGRTVSGPGVPNARAALDAGAAEFERVFLGAFGIR
jgi:pyrimidine-specific ribonucleoside hydrolase